MASNPANQELTRPRWRAGLAALGGTLSTPVAATPLPDPELVHADPVLREQLRDAGWAPDDRKLTELTAGTWLPDGCTHRASVYAGHQFGVWVPQLGDGRALLIGELDTPACPLELQIKGGGRTPFSRMGDGRAVLRSTIREYLCSAAMRGLGIPTTGALSLVVSSERVQRETLEPAAALIRTAPSHLRFGHYEYFAHSDQHDTLRALADWTIAEHFPAHAGDPPDYAGWATEVINRTARLVAQWQAAGFCHGVMNTDNLSILGLTIDYGPYGFLDTFDAGHVCNHSDHAGRYAWDQQPRVAHWNCARFLQALLPLLAADEDQAVAIATEILDRYQPAYAEAALTAWRGKLGLAEARDDDAELVQDLLGLLQQHRLDFGISFRRFAEHASADCPADWSALAGFDDWWTRYRERCRVEPVDDAAHRERAAAHNPVYVLRNHLAQRAIDAAHAGDLTEIDTLMTLLAEPCTRRDGFEAYEQPPPADAPSVPISCSS